jgi:predicted small secreted protein
MKNAIFSLLLIIITAGAISGCANTLEGVGRDLENIGETVQDL